MAVYLVKGIVMMSKTRARRVPFQKSEIESARAYIQRLGWDMDNGSQDDYRGPNGQYIYLGMNHIQAQQLEAAVLRTLVEMLKPTHFQKDIGKAVFPIDSLYNNL